MIATFTQSLPNETFKSSLARFKKMSLMSDTHIARRIFGTERILINSLYPARLQNAEKALRDISYITADEIILKNSLQPLGRNFWSAEKNNLILNYMRDGSSGFQFFKKIEINNYLYCPLCAKEDKVKYKDKYFHREHFIPNIRICCHHHCFLESWSLNQGTHTKHALISLNDIYNESSLVRFCKDDQLIKFSKKLYRLLIGKEHFDRYSVVDEAYKKGIIKYYPKRVVLNNDSIQSIINLISFSHPSVREYYLSRVKEIPKFFFKYWHGSDPTLSLLIEKFVNDAKSLLKPKLKYGPFQCINYFCPNYEKYTITNYELIKVYFRSHKGVRLECHCGMVYQFDLDVNRIVKIVDYGAQFRSGVKKMFEKGHSFRSLELATGCDRKKLLKLVASGERSTSRAESFYNLVLLERRKQWAAEITSKTFVSIKLSRLKLKTIYRWLLKNDSKWIVSFNKKFHVKKKPRKKVQIDFTTLDNQYANLIKNKIEELIKENGQRRITKQLLTELKELNFVFMNLRELPYCQKVINEKCESIFNYRIRKIENYLFNIRVSSQTVTKSFVLEKFKIKPRLLTKKELNEVNYVIRDLQY